MTIGQSALTFECDLIGIRDDESLIPVKSTLLGFSPNNRLAESFALICKDQTEEVRQKLEVEEAKRKSDSILLQILPKDIILRLNRGDTEISFTVETSTIIFIDIVQFSTYMATLPAQTLMINLSSIFQVYDNLLGQFPLLTKIKFIGDVFMAAGGLFDPTVDPAAHANEMLLFALKVLAAIEELNIQLGASLQVRIGINTDGPLIAGVLGTEKPLFDIIGDCINVAARLQSTDIPGKVQISETTYNLVCSGGYNIEKRGEIELKGKGKRLTYIVHPPENSPQ